MAWLAIARTLVQKYPLSLRKYNWGKFGNTGIPGMYVIAIGWLYVVVMIAAVSDSLLKGVIRFVFLGALPVGLLLWVKLMRYRAREAERAQETESIDVTRGPD